MGKETSIETTGGELTDAFFGSGISSEVNAILVNGAEFTKMRQWRRLAFAFVA